MSDIELRKPPPRGLLILGFGGHARAVADVAMAMGITELAFEDESALTGEHFQGFKVLPVWKHPLPDGWMAFGAAGQSTQRQAQLMRIRTEGWPVATLVAPTASLGVGCTIGPGSIVGQQAHVGPMVAVGDGCIINSGAIVDHESVVGDFSHISVNASVAGRCTIGRNVMLGAGATVIDKITMCDDIVIGAGAVVTENLICSGTYVGVPVRLLKTMK